MIGNISSFQPQTIQPRSQAILLVSVRLMLFGLVNDIINAFQYHNFQQSITLNAEANVDNLIVPVNENFVIG